MMDFMFMLCRIKNKKVIFAKSILKWIGKGSILACFILSVLLRSKTAEAYQKIEAHGDRIEFTTTDTKAQYTTTWREVGFTIRRDRSYGNPTADSKYTYVALQKPFYQKETEPGIYTVSFEFSRADIDAALEKAGLGTTDENDTFYMNGVFAVNRSGVDDAAYYRTLDGIKYAAPWRNPDDFKEHFDIKVWFPVVKYPVTAECRTDQGILLKEISFSEKEQNRKKGQKAEVSFEEELKKEGKTYQLYRSYWINPQIPTKKREDRRKKQGFSIKEIKNREAVMEEGGIQFIALYKKEIAITEEKVTEDEMEKELDSEIETEGSISAMKRGAEEYEVEQGIPSSEAVYAEGSVPEYLISYHFLKKKGEKTYQVRIKRTYHLNWTTQNIVNDKIETESHSTTKTVTAEYNVKRCYAFWYVKRFRLYLPEIFLFQNDIFLDGNKGEPGGSITGKLEILGKEIICPEIFYLGCQSEKEHIQEPEYQRTVRLSDCEVSGDGSEPSVPDEDFTEEAEAAVGEIKARNDCFFMDGKEIMEDGFHKREGSNPALPPAAQKRTKLECFLEENLVIPKEKPNGIYDSEGMIRYHCQIEKKSPMTKEEAEENNGDIHENKEDFVRYPGKTGEIYAYYEVDGINEVVVHTPVICEPALEDKYRDCQLVEPSYAHCQLVLGKPFMLVFPTVGEHQQRKGYGYRDYAKFTDSREVKFPFPVYEKKGSLCFHKENTWIEVGEETNFYLPTWVKEGQTEVSFRTVSINARPNNSLEKTGMYQNANLWEYVAVKQIPVEVSGRFYGLNLYDISDYPLWQEVFRQKDSFRLSGKSFFVGEQDEDGNRREDHNLQFPVIKGSHPFQKLEGILKGGYKLRFKLTTIGNMTGKEDIIRIIPSFYYLNVETGIKIPVDLYYQETIDGNCQKLVRTSSRLDADNWKEIQLGSPYLSIPEKEIYLTSQLRGKSVEELKGVKREIYRYPEIKLPSEIQMQTGIFYQSDHNIPIEDGQDFFEVGSSVQNWYFEYSLPANFHAVSKDFKLEEYTKGGSIDFQEDFWMKNGYLLLNFELETIERGERHLSYINKENARKGYRNMWEQEGFYSQRKDADQRQYLFNEGDIALFSLKNSTWNEYRSGGTH